MKVISVHTDSRNIKKHKNDVYRLFLMLTFENSVLCER